MRGSEVELAGKASLFVSLFVWIPLIIFGFYSTPSWIVASYLTIFGIAFALIFFRTSKLDFDLVRRSSKEDWELFLGGLAGYFVIGGVLLAVFQVLGQAVSQTTCVQPPRLPVNDPNCFVTQTTTYPGVGAGNLLNLGVLGYYMIIVGLLFSAIFFPFFVFLSARAKAFWIESDYYP